MIQIEDVVVSFDVLREKFLCNLDACKGECCIEGDAGAPVELEEVEKLEEVLPVIWEELSPEARAVIEKQGVVYTDQEGDLVTSIVNNKDCVFTCYDEKGCCYCAIEKAYRDGKTDFYKPVSCHLYPIRIGDYGPYKAVNYHRQDLPSSIYSKLSLAKFWPFSKNEPHESARLNHQSKSQSIHKDLF